MARLTHSIRFVRKPKPMQTPKRNSNKMIDLAIKGAQDQGKPTCLINTNSKASIGNNLSTAEATNNAPKRMRTIGMRIDDFTFLLYSFVFAFKRAIPYFCVENRSFGSGRAHLLGILLIGFGNDDINILSEVELAGTDPVFFTSTKNYKK